jgi:hypothetical protein
VVAAVFRQEGMVVREHFGVIESFEWRANDVLEDGKRASVETAIAVIATAWIADTVGLKPLRSGCRARRSRLRQGG